MEINWFEICVEIINFVILMAILKKFLYRPVLTVIQKREQNIKNIYEESQRKLNEGENLIFQYEKKLQSIEIERREILEKTHKVAEIELEKFREQNRIQSEKEKKFFMEEFTTEKKQLLNSVKDFIIENSLTLSEDIIQKISSASLAEGMIENLLEEIEKRGELKEIKNFKKMKISLSHSVSDSVKEKIRNCFKRRDLDPEEIVFLVDSSLILGYELDLGDFLISKNVKEILHDYKKKLVENYD